MSIIDISSIDFDKSNITLVNGLTLERVKIKYNWLLNAKIKDAIIGENERGIVWYCGDWYCGEWLDGTWYSGNFYDGIWKNGLWYSFSLNKFDIVNEKFFIKHVGNEYSQFHNGYWLNGVFYGGTFGINSGETWENFELYTDDIYPNYRAEHIVIGGDIQYKYKKLATWINGTFEFGDFYDAIWSNGQFLDGYMKNSKWIDGCWFFGTFDGHTWHNGYWYNGEFINGTWLNGTFTKLKNELISRFGNTILNTIDNESICRWYDGIWKNGEWFSGYVTDANNNPIESIYNYLSIWYGGTWENGIWYGGHFKDGIWKNGIWKNGVFGFFSSTNWITPQLVSQEYDSAFLGARWNGDSNIPTITRDSALVTTSNTGNTQYEWTYQNITIDISNITRYQSYIQFAQNNNVDFYTDIYNNNTFVNSSNEYDLINIMNNQNHTIYLNNNTAYTYKILSAVLSGDTYNRPYWKLTLTGDTIITDYIFPVNGHYITSLKIIVKEKIILDQGSGSGFTYLDFNSTQSKQNISNNYKIYNKYNINGEDITSYDILYDSTVYNFLQGNNIISNNNTYNILNYEKINIDDVNSPDFIRIYVNDTIRNNWDNKIVRKTESLINTDYNIYNFNNNKRTIDIYSNWYGVTIHSGDTLKITPQNGGGIEYIYVLSITNIINEYENNNNIYRISYDTFPTGNTINIEDEYINITCFGNFVSFITTTNPSYKIGDYVYIEQDLGYINSEYNGIAQIIDTGTTLLYSISNPNPTYYVTTSKKYRVNSSNQGKMVKYLGLYHDRLLSQGPSLTFQDINFDFDFILNPEYTKINGYTIKYDSYVSNNNSEHSNYNYDLIYLPLKDLFFNHKDDNNTDIYVPYDSCKYGIEYRSHFYSDISEGKNNSSMITNKNDNTQKTNYFGGVNDLWGIQNLKEYYQNDVLYDITNLETANSRMRISLQFMLNGTITQQLFIKNVQIKAYYSDSSSKPIWEKGTWYKGTWCDGVFYDGSFLSGLWLNGVFQNGTIASGYR